MSPSLFKGVSNKGNLVEQEAPQVEESSWGINPQSSRQANEMLAPASKMQVAIGSECRIIGDLDLSGTARIDGAIEGEIRSRAGELVIGESAVIHAKIYGESVHIFGRVDGDIACSERIEIHSGACVTGSITSPRVAIEDGVVFEGMCRMSEAPKQESIESVDKVIEMDAVSETDQLVNDDS